MLEPVEAPARAVVIVQLPCGARVGLEGAVAEVIMPPACISPLLTLETWVTPAATPDSRAGFVTSAQTLSMEVSEFELFAVTISIDMQ